MNLDTFIQSGTRPTSLRETSALLDSCRNQILLLTKSQTTMSNKLFTPEDQAFLRANKGSISALTAHKAAQALKPKTPILDALVAGKGKLPTAAAAAKPAAPIATAPPAPKLTTAAEFTGSPLVMARSEWQSLSHSNRAKFFSDGGKLVD